MKKYIVKSVSVLALAMSAYLTGCEDTLDADKYFDDRRTIESVFTDINQTNGWLAQAYSYLRTDLAEVCTKERHSVGLHNFADDYYYGDRDNRYQTQFDAMESYNAFKQGDYDENYGSNF